MPLLCNGEYREVVPNVHTTNDPGRDDAVKARLVRSQSQHSGIAKTAIMSHVTQLSKEESKDSGESDVKAENGVVNAKAPKAVNGDQPNHLSSGKALTDTPLTTAPNTPVMLPKNHVTGSPQPLRPRSATTLDIPGLTRSKVSPDGKIAQRDVGSKLVIVMVGLPARGKSYITKKLARYLNWLQHDTRIFNVGERRRVVAAPQNPHGHSRPSSHHSRHPTNELNGYVTSKDVNNPGEKLATPPSSPSTQIRLNGDLPPATPPFEKLPPSALDFLRQEHFQDQPPGSPASPPPSPHASSHDQSADQLEQSAQFFDPSNQRASAIREQVAMETLDELLDFILEKGGSVGIFDATNSTHERRRAIMQKIRSRAGPELGVLFLESVCIDENLLEANMRLKLSGPDYKDQDPIEALEDFKKRVAMYQKKYLSLGDYEERNGMQYIQMIDVGRKIISHQIKGFLSAQTNYYLLNFNLAPRQIWITRHGESMDNVKGKIGGDSDLTGTGKAYARTLNAFIQDQRQLWLVRQQDKASTTHFPPQKGDTTPPNPAYATNEAGSVNFCVWTSMLKRSIQTAQFFDEEEFDVKQMKMLDELNAGIMEGHTYDEIKNKFSEEYELRKRDKLHYRYPGAGGEGYLDIINRLRPVIHEVERMTDHVLLVGHRSVARVLLAYFLGLKREDVANLDVPLGVLYMLEPKPYGVDFKAYRYNAERQWFDYEPDYELQSAKSQTAY